MGNRAGRAVDQRHDHRDGALAGVAADAVGYDPLYQSSAADGGRSLLSDHHSSHHHDHHHDITLDVEHDEKYGSSSQSDTPCFTFSHSDNSSFNFIYVIIPM
jgi:hypothetical protein